MTSQQPFNGPQIMSRGDSESVVATPWEFIQACEKRWGKLDCDLAASHYNTKAPRYFTEEQDALKQDWDAQPNPLAPVFLNWLNPPFDKIGPWAKKCSESKCRILFLTPASVDSNWWADYVHDKALVLPLHPRLKFEGHTSLYPKALTLSLYNFGEVGYPGRWKWKKLLEEVSKPSPEKTSSDTRSLPLCP